MIRLLGTGPEDPTRDGWPAPFEVPMCKATGWLTVATVLALPTGSAAAQGASMPRGLAADSVFEVAGTMRYRVAATRDGWVLVGRAPAGEPEALPSLVGKAFFTPSEVEGWAARVEEHLGVLQRAGAASPSRSVELRAGPDIRLSATPFEGRNGTVSWALRVGECGRPMSVSISTDDLHRVLEALRSAAATARRSGGPHLVPSPPTALFWSHAVGCPAVPDDSATFPTHPLAPPEGETVGVSMVVSADGRVEAGTVHVLSSPSGEIVSAARERLLAWRFRPARRAGAPVRERVHAVIAVYPPEQSGADAWPVASPVLLGDEVEPWIRVRDGLGDRRLPRFLDGRLQAPRYTLVPATDARAWANTVLALLTDASLDPAEIPEATLDLGVQPEPVIRFRRHDATLTRIPCWGHLFSGGWEDAAETARAVAHASAAALAGTGERVEPSVETRGLLTATCPARPAQKLTLRTDPNGASAQVFASVVVGTDGRVDIGSLRLAPVADPSLTAQLRDSLEVWRFHPARTAGRAVPQRMYLDLLADAAFASPDREAPIEVCTVASPSGQRILVAGPAEYDTWRPWARVLAAALRGASHAGDEAAWAFVDVTAAVERPAAITVRSFGSNPGPEADARLEGLVALALSVAGDPPDIGPIRLSVRFEGGCA